MLLCLFVRVVDVGYVCIAGDGVGIANVGTCVCNIDVAIGIIIGYGVVRSCFYIDDAGCGYVGDCVVVCVVCVGSFVFLDITVIVGIMLVVTLLCLLFTVLIFARVVFCAIVCAALRFVCMRLVIML